MWASVSRLRTNTWRTPRAASAICAVPVVRLLLMSLRDADVGGLPDEMLAAVHRDHLARNGFGAEKIAHRVADVLWLGTVAERRRFALPAEIDFALAGIGDGWSRRHCVYTNARSQ